MIKTKRNLPNSNNQVYLNCSSFLVDPTRHHFGAASLDNVTPVPLITRFPVPDKSPSPVCAEVSIACLFGNLSPDVVRLGLSETVSLPAFLGGTACFMFKPEKKTFVWFCPRAVTISTSLHMRVANAITTQWLTVQVILHLFIVIGGLMCGWDF